MTNLVHDVRYAIRLIRRRPGLSAAAILTLALGMGANTAIFTVVNAVLLRPLPYAASERLVFVSINANTGFGDRTSIPVADFLAWRAVNRACQHVAVFTDSETVAVSGSGPAEAVVATAASAGFFQALGVTPAIGRVWREGDDQPGVPSTSIVSYRFWMEHLRGGPAVLGRSLIIQGRRSTIIGVAPPDFAFLSADNQVWTILPLDPPARRGPYFLHGLGLMKPAAMDTQVQADLAIAATQLRQQFPGQSLTRYRVESLKSVITGDAKPALLVLLAAVAVVLLVAIVNVANLLLARAAEREREIAVRTALGAAPGRLVSQLVTEGFVLAIAGAATGSLVASWATRILVAFAPANLPRAAEITTDWRVFGFTLLVGAVSGVLFGAAPGIHLSNRRFVETMQSGIRSADRATRTFPGALIVAEIALALMLTTGAGLLTKSLIRLQQVDVGFDPEHVVTASITPPHSTYPDQQRLVGYFTDLVQRIEALPSVAGAALTNSVPPDGLSETDNFIVEDNPPPQNRSAPVGPILSVSSGYFRVLHVRLLRGRWFDDVNDSASSAPVAIISASLAKQHFGRLDPIGRRIKQVADWPRADSNPWLTIIGVVDDVKYAGLAEGTGPALYLHLRQVAFRGQNVVVRASGDPSIIVNTMRDAVRAIDPDVPLANIRTMDDRLWRAAGAPRFRTSLMALFGVMGLSLAAIGVYGVINYSVTERRREIGIRTAMGATRRNILELVLADTARLAIAGAAIGVVLALLAGRLLGSVLYAVSPADTAVLAGATIVLLFVAMLAGFLPARRAAAVDPSVVLRSE